ncbi:hypothetical protein SAMN02910293_01140 [Streptococcus henryi]|uniref:Uncharacterized protein n=1 Tax=Streptococcus henryi TaxID=439219 RepID=A0A1G6BPN1_9STRE|nr:hypothetical protein [Streptococcus henryi]SDB22515.1 hypothetical protein SAMN02910293_01140 [Streptococcus henryi]
MSDNIEIIMDIETLEIFEVIDLDEMKEAATTDIKDSLVEEQSTPYDELNRVWLGNGYYYKPSSFIWGVEKDGATHELSHKNKHGTYPYYRRARDGTWRHIRQLTQEEALWLTLEFHPELMDFV